MVRVKVGAENDVDIGGSNASSGERAKIAGFRASVPVQPPAALLVLADAAVDQDRQPADAQDEALNPEQQIAALEVDVIRREGRSMGTEIVEFGAGEQKRESESEGVEIDDPLDYR